MLALPHLTLPLLCFSSGYECIPIRAHAAVATQSMPWGLSNTESVSNMGNSHVGLWGILWALIRGI